MAFDCSCIPVVDFLECLDVKHIAKATENEVKFSCPYPAHVRGDTNPSAYMNIHTTAFLCQSCHAKGNAVIFTSDILGVSQIEAVRLLRQRYSPAGIDLESRSIVEEVKKILNKKKPEKRENKAIPKNVIDQYHVEWKQWQKELAEPAPPWASYMFMRGFSATTLNVWGFGYCEERQRITLPVRDENGVVIGIKGRALNDRKPKYLNMRGNGHEPYLKNEVVFAIWEAGLWGHTDLIVVEGEFNAVMMHQYGFSNTVAINGSYFGQRQLRLLKERADSVTLFFDSDRAGWDATKLLTEALTPFMPVFVCPDHHGDPCEMHRNSVFACLGDKRSALTLAVRS